MSKLRRQPAQPAATIINHSVLEDGRIGYTAVGLYAYLISTNQEYVSDEYIYNRVDAYEMDAVKTAIEQLRKHGYLEADNE